MNGKLFCYELWILRRNEVWNVRKTHKNDYMSYTECRMLPINAMVLVCISQLHFTQDNWATDKTFLIHLEQSWSP